jgi:NAD(P)-dependent dehydrogenase (short-subunit alcohol dehydrogenase family)
VNLFDLTENVAVVLGATGVLGGAIAEGLAVAGARVAVLGRNAGRGEARVRCIQNKGARRDSSQPTPSTKARSLQRAKPS